MTGLKCFSIIKIFLREMRKVGPGIFMRTWIKGEFSEQIARQTKSYSATTRTPLSPSSGIGFPNDAVTDLYVANVSLPVLSTTITSLVATQTIKDKANSPKMRGAVMLVLTRMNQKGIWKDT